VRLIIHLQFGCIPLCSCVCSRFAGKDLAFLARSTVQRRSITRGVVVLRLQGSEPSCSEAGSNCVVTPPNRELSEPFGRSGTLVHITVFLGNIHSVVGLRTSWCFVRTFGGDFGTVANYFRKNFSAPIHPPSGHRFRSFRDGYDWP
jgi:hypothetical protein